MLKKKLLAGAALAVAFLGTALGVRADSVTFTFGGSSTTWNGTPFPNSGATYLTAVFTDTGAAGSGTVDLTLTASLPVGAPMDADISDIAFNMSPYISNLIATGPAGVTMSISNNGEKISNFKQLDILFDTGVGYAHSVLEGTESVTLHLTGNNPAPLTAATFDVADPSGAYAVGKIQTTSASYESTSNGSPDIVNTPNTGGSPLLPLPKAAWAGLALLGLLALRRKPSIAIVA
jgi:hypothetical protein